MPNLIPQDIREWMRRMEFKVNDLTRRMSSLIPGDIADGVNLNDFKSSGRWRRPSVSGTTTAQGYPKNNASGTLEVYWDPGNVQVHQIFYDRSGSHHERWWNGTVWSPWTGVWVNITNWNAGVTPQTGSNTPQIMRQGNIVVLRGRCSTTGISGAYDMGTIPSGYGFEPTGVQEMGHGATNGSATSRTVMNPTGVIGVQAWVNNNVLALTATYGVG